MLNTLLDLFYPRSCYGCSFDEPAATANLCWECLSGVLVVQPPFCSVCGNPVHGYIDHDYVCSLCSASRPAFDRAVSGARYDGIVREMVMSLKYGRALWLVSDLAYLLETVVRAHYPLDEIDAVAAVPLHGRKYRERGFNQAELLARALAASLDKPLLRRCLVRVRSTDTQTHLTAAQRLTNVRGAFEPRWNRWIEERRVLLVDDVMTTGATASECARALRGGGARKVYVATVARR